MLQQAKTKQIAASSTKCNAATRSEPPATPLAFLSPHADIGCATQNIDFTSCSCEDNNGRRAVKQSKSWRSLPASPRSSLIGLPNLAGDRADLQTLGLAEVKIMHYGASNQVRNAARRSSSSLRGDADGTHGARPTRYQQTSLPSTSLFGDNSYGVYEPLALRLKPQTSTQQLGMKL